MTSKKKDIIVVGAGPAGLVAAINLNREGLNVIVRERQDRVGGEPGWHPSIHSTPVDMPGLWDYIGIDCSEAFTDISDNNTSYFDGQPVGKLTDMDPAGSTFYNTERGHRETSLDSFLFRIAEKEGVNFEFNRPFKEDDFSSAPKGTIIASGLSPGVYKGLGMEYNIFAGYWAYTDIDDDDVSAAGYVGGFTNEYGYAASLNKIWYVLLFARKEVSKENLEAFKAQLEECEGRKFDKWRRFIGQAPRGPRLFYKDFIMTGTAGGFIEPAFSFGITGALLSGKISALAALEPERGEKEFNRFANGIVTHIARKKQPGYMPDQKMGDIWFKVE